MILTREIAALVGSVGVLLLLMPLSWRPRRSLGLTLTTAAWIVMGLSLALEGTLATRIKRPAVAAVAVAGLLVALGLLVLAARLVRAHPGIWFAALAVALPVRLPLSLGEGDSHNLLLPLYCVIAVGLAVWFLELRGTKIEDPNPAALDVPVGLFVALSLASVLWTSAGHEAAVKAGFFYLPFTLAYLLVLRMWPRARSIRILAWSTAAVSIVVAVIALVQYETRTVFWNETLKQGHKYGRFFRVNSIFYDPNILGRFLVLGILGAVAAALWWRTPRVLVWSGLFCVLQMLALAVSVSRSSALALMLGLTLLSARAFRPRRVIALLAALLLVGGGVAAAGSKNVRRVMTDAQYLSHVSEGRFALIKGGLKIWRQAPVLGVGIGSFETEYKQSFTRGEKRRTRVFISHNTPVTVLSELGIVGVGGLAALLVWGASVVRRRSRLAGGPGWAAWTGLAMMAGIFIHSTLYAAFFEDPYLWVIAGGTMALLASSRPGKVGEAPGVWALGGAESR